MVDWMVSNKSFDLWTAGQNMQRNHWPPQKFSRPTTPERMVGLMEIGFPRSGGLFFESQRPQQIRAPNFLSFGKQSFPKGMRWSTRKVSLTRLFWADRESQSHKRGPLEFFSLLWNITALLRTVVFSLRMSIFPRVLISVLASHAKFLSESTTAGDKRA